jgi:Putative DNA-binding domain
VALLHIPVDRIDQSHIQVLIDSKSAETRNIEYKRESYGPKDADRAEFLADISSFANSAGGDLLIGVDAVGGVPIKLTPFIRDADAELLRLEQMARSGLEPRIPNIQTKAIQVGVGGKVLVIRIPQSYRKPHRVIFQQKNRFWSRSSAGKFEPNVDELRALFTFAPQLAEQMRQFRLKQITQIVADEGPVRLKDSHCVVLHIVPFTHFCRAGSSISIADVLRNAQYFPPLGMGARQDWRINFDGFVTLSNHSGERQRAYVQLFHSGAVEAVASCINNEQLGVNIADIAKMMVQHSYLYFGALHDYGIEPPLAVMASLVGVSQLALTTGRTSIAGHEERQIADRDQFHFTELILETIPETEQECAEILRPTLDQFANAAGCVSARSLGDTTNYAE